MLRVLLGKLFYMAQCCPTTRMFLNRMMRSCPAQGKVKLSLDFTKDLIWIQKYPPATNGISIIKPTYSPTTHI